MAFFTNNILKVLDLILQVTDAIETFFDQGTETVQSHFRYPRGLWSVSYTFGVVLTTCFGQGGWDPLVLWAFFPEVIALRLQKETGIYK